jgi:hypothetical protein
MSDKIKRALVALAALAALALGGAAIANATSNGGSQDQGAAVENEADGSEAMEAADAPDAPGDREDGGEQGAADDSASRESETADDQGGDGDGSLPAAAEQKARTAAEQATGGQATGDVEPAEQADPVEDPSDQPTPKGAAYEVEITKNGQALKVFLDSSFNEIETQQDAG